MKSRVKFEQCPRKNDEKLQELLSVIKEGWPDCKDKILEVLKPYFDFSDSMSYQDGIILKGTRILIPSKLRNSIKTKLHVAHLGYDSMMRRARDAIFWPGMSKEIKQMVNSCDICQQYKPRNQKESLMDVDDGGRPWNKIGLDLFEIVGRNYLVIVDYYSSFTKVEFLTSTTSNHVIAIIKKMFARYGIPTQLVSDGGPQFSSFQFKRHPQGNGKAEAAVKIVKNMMKTTHADVKDQYLALLELRNTPRQDSNLSPAQMMFGRKLRSIIPEIMNNDNSVSQKRETRRESIKKYYDKTARDMIPLNEGQPVYYQNPDKKGWEKGLISHAQGNRSYITEGKEGGIYRRNRIHIRPTTQDSSAIPDMEETSKLRESSVNDEQTSYHPICDMPKLPRSARLHKKMKGE